MVEYRPVPQLEIGDSVLVYSIASSAGTDTCMGESRLN